MVIEIARLAIYINTAQPPQDPTPPPLGGCWGGVGGASGVQITTAVCAKRIGLTGKYKVEIIFFKQYERMPRFVRSTDMSHFGLNISEWQFPKDPQIIRIP